MDPGVRSGRFRIAGGSGSQSRRTAWYECGVIPLLRSELLDRAGFAHGFSTRDGGVSAPPFASMNLARAVGDDPEAVSENYRRFAEALAVPVERLFETNQVHGSAVCVVDGGSEVVATRGRDADALVTRIPGLAVGVRVADCVPILLADPDSGAVAAVHAGWRGCAAEVLDRSLDALEAHAGIPPRRLLAAIFPHISERAFEVGDEVVDALTAVAHGVPFVDRTRAKPHVDLGAVVRAQLLARGVPAAQVERVPGCTYGEPERFHSFRRDGKRSGRHLAAIVARHASGGKPPQAW